MSTVVDNTLGDEYMNLCKRAGEIYEELMELTLSIQELEKNGNYSSILNNLRNDYDQLLEQHVKVTQRKSELIKTMK